MIWVAAIQEAEQEQMAACGAKMFKSAFEGTPSSNLLKEIAILVTVNPKKETPIVGLIVKREATWQSAGEDIADDTTPSGEYHDSEHAGDDIGTHPVHVQGVVEGNREKIAGEATACRQAYEDIKVDKALLEEDDRADPGADVDEALDALVSLDYASLYKLVNLSGSKLKRLLRPSD
ncbi:hypothetical protein L1887_14975 [Cichorium endivia]|nr:hypothetical protein L1887_14975 [Cichorium endivia]